MTSLIGILEFSPERREWQVFLPERANTKFLSRGVADGPSNEDKQAAKEYLRLNGFDVATRGWRQDGRTWTIEVRPSRP